MYSLRLPGVVLALLTFLIAGDAFAQFPPIRNPFPTPKPPSIPNPIDEAAKLDRARLEAQRRAEEAARKKAAELAAARKRAEEEARKLAERKAAIERRARQIRDEFERLQKTAERNRRDYDRMQKVLSGGPGKAREEAVEMVRRAGVLGTNKAQVRQSIQGRVNLTQVIYAKEFDHYEQQQLATAIGASVASGNPGPVLLYLQGFLAQSKLEVTRNLTAAKGEARDKLLREFDMLIIKALDKALSGGRPLEVNFGGVDVEVGLATYNHWGVIRWDEPSLEYVSSGVPGLSMPRIKQTPRERKLPLPNTFQPYLKVRVRVSSR